MWPVAESLDTLTQSWWPTDRGKSQAPQSPIFSSEQRGIGTDGSGKRKDLPAKQEMQVRSLSQEDPLEEEMATHSSMLTLPGQRSLMGYSPWDCKELDMT